MKQLILVLGCNKKTLLLLLVTTASVALWFGKDQVTNLLPLKINYYQLLPIVGPKPFSMEFLNITNNNPQQPPSEVKQPLTQHTTLRSTYQEITRKFYIPYHGAAITAENWKGHCPYPLYIPIIMKKQSWFQPFLFHLQRVNLSRTGTSAKAKMQACTRWWSATPQLDYNQRFVKTEPYRGQERLNKWKAYPKPPVNYTRPPCEGFGRKLIPRTSCATKLEKLWKALDRVGVVYYPRAGTDLGVARSSSYLSTDGDIDMFVDMPQKKLVAELRKVLKPAPYFSKARGVWAFTTETHWWSGSGCPTVHMVFNDWITDEMTQHFLSRYPRYQDTCECLMNSVPLSCHKETVYRTWLMYGPSWRVPLHAKALDVPHRARGYNVAAKLKKMKFKDGLIRERTVRDLDKNVQYTTGEMEMILAQLNDLHALISCQNDKTCRKKLLWY